jgi:hypothetical protein
LQDASLPKADAQSRQLSRELRTAPVDLDRLEREREDALYSEGGGVRSTMGRRPALMQTKSHMINGHSIGEKKDHWLTTLRHKERGEFLQNAIW